MAALSIIVEGRMDAELLRRLLPREDVAGARFFAAEGRISLSTVGRNVVVHEGGPLLVVMDADTLDEDAAEETRRYTKAIISHVAGRVPVDVFAFVPEIEIVFFEAPDCLSELFGHQLSEVESLKGLASPKRMLATLLEHSRPQYRFETFVRRIDERAADVLRQGNQLAALIEMVHALREREARLGA